MQLVLRADLNVERQLRHVEGLGAFGGRHLIGVTQRVLQDRRADERQIGRAGRRGNAIFLKKIAEFSGFVRQYMV